MRESESACRHPRGFGTRFDGEAVVRLSLRPIPNRQLVLKLAVAANDNDRDLGLMCVTALRPQHGMIFVFGSSQHWEFWMKNTLVPLDMVWLATDGKITTIASHVPASTRETSDMDVARRGGSGRFVIELADGEALADGLSVGEKLSLPPLHASQ